MSKFLQRIVNKEPGEGVENKAPIVVDISTDRVTDMMIGPIADRTTDISPDTIESPSADIIAEPPAAPVTHISSLRPAAIPTNEPANRPPDRPSDRPTYQYLDATHTNSEKAVYSILYRETISKKRRTVEMSQGELRRATGIGGVNTIKRAVEGLVDKLSIRIISSGAGSVVGTNYEVYPPLDILAARRAVKMEIHPKTKKIVGLSANISAGLFMNRPDGPAGNRFDRADDLDGSDISKTDGHDKYNINPPVTPSIVVAPDDDKLPRVRKLFEQLSNGGTWKDDRDLKAYEQIAHLGIWHIILGICFSQDRCPEHHISSLAYCVPAILKHAEDMAEFPESYLIDIAYKSKRKIMQAIETGKWTAP